MPLTPSAVGHSHRARRESGPPVRLEAAQLIEQRFSANEDGSEAVRKGGEADSPSHSVPLRFSCHYCGRAHDVVQEMERN